VRAVEAVNARAGKAVAAYTFDAGRTPWCTTWLRTRRRLRACQGIVAGGGGVGWAGIKEEDAGLWMSSERDAALWVKTVFLTRVGTGREVEKHLIDEKGDIVMHDHGDDLIQRSMASIFQLM